VQIWDGIIIEDDAFIGPNTTFTNDRFPRSKQYPEHFLKTVIKQGASIGANATLLPGITIGENAMIGAGSVVIRSVPARAIVVGNPAKIIGYINTPKSTINPEPINKQGLYTTSVKDVTLHCFPDITDLRGSLSFGEFEKNIPFKPSRYFLVFNVESSEIRGEHAHKTCHQFLICAKGSCSVIADDGINREQFKLDHPSKGLYLPPMTWGIQYQYTKDAVLLVFASAFYDAADYIRDYDEFKKLAVNQTK
jgi:hypothetical protein